MNKDTKHTDDGFTIVELVVAMVVAAILISSSMVALISEDHLSQRNRDLVVANSYVEGKVEALRNIGFLGLTDGTTNLVSELPSELNSPRSASLQVSSYATSIKQVDISVTYNDQGTARNYSYTTYIGELGVGK
jgi:prepilin-type N-terminal cleavage/methylation domain-containing protein